jgi:RHS repeat-associated protein
MRTATDPNGQTTTAHYYPNSLRHFRTERPDGSYTESSYNDGLVSDPDPSRMHSYVFTKSLFDTGREVLACVFLDGRGAPARTFYGVSNNYITADTEYDVMGRAYRWSNPYYTIGSVGAVNPSGEWTTSRYDALGRADQVTLADGAMTQTTYAGSVTTGTDPAGKARRQVTDALGRLVRLNEPNDAGDLGTVSAPTRPTSYQYNALNNLVRITQEGQSRFFKYDSLGRLTHDRQVEQSAPHYAPDPLTGNNEWSSRVVYNDYGVVEESFDARGVRTGFIYDTLNRVKEITYSDGTPTVTYTYDTATPGYYNRGHLQRVVTAATGSVPETSQTYNYDRMGRVANHQQSIGTNVYTLAYAYNFAGSLKSLTYPSGRTVTYSFDQLNRLSAAADVSRTYASNIAYSPYGGLSSETFGNGASHTIGYNSRTQTSWIDLTKSGATLQRYDYKYGVVDQSTGVVDETKNNGQIARLEGSIGAALQPPARQWQQRASYDSLGRLSVFGEYRGDSLALTLKAHYTHDRYGNRFQTGAQNIGIDYLALSSADVNAANNRILSNGGYTMEYDGAGNLTRDGRFRSMQYSYDANARQKYASRLDGTHGVTSTYDALGQRVSERVVGTTRHLIYDAFGKLLSEYATVRTGQQRWERDHIYRNDQAVAVEEAAPTCYKSLDQFIRDFYQGALARQPNSTELSIWIDHLTKAQARGGGYLLAETQALGDTLFNSADYALRARTDRDFVYDIYKAYLQREPDQGGWDAWTNAIPANGRPAVRQGFAASTEFGDNVGLLCATSGPGGVRYLLMDHQGSTRVVMNEAGAVVARHDMMPYGEEIWAGAGLRTAAQGYAQTDEVRQRYGMTERDEATGLEHTLWRKYDSWQGRWTSPDPYRGSMSAGNPQSFNRYVYVNNDPLNLVDPLGLCTFNINLKDTSGLTPTQIEGVKKEIKEIFEAAGQQVVFGNPGGASGPRLTYNLTVVSSFPKSVIRLAGKNRRKLNDFLGITIPDRYNRPSNTGYVFEHQLSLHSENGYSYPFSIGRVGAHEAGHFFLDIKHGEGLEGGVMADVMNPEALADENADDKFRFTPEQAEKLSNLCPPDKPNVGPGGGGRGGGGGGGGGGGSVGGPSGFDWLYWWWDRNRQAETERQRR